jgi:hypothetical protein
MDIILQVEERAVPSPPLFRFHFMAQSRTWNRVQPLSRVKIVMADFLRLACSEKMNRNIMDRIGDFFSLAEGTTEETTGVVYWDVFL